jgi:hypothetical protein
VIVSARDGDKKALWGVQDPLIFNAPAGDLAIFEKATGMFKPGR